MNDLHVFTKADVSVFDRSVIVAYRHNYVAEYETVPIAWIEQKSVRQAIDYANMYVLNKLLGIRRRSRDV